MFRDSKPIDEEAASILRKGDLRLISAIWLLQQGEEYRVERLQDLPAEAFLAPEEAAELLLEPPIKSMTRIQVDGPKSIPTVLAPRVVNVSYRWHRDIRV